MRNVVHLLAGVVLAFFSSLIHAAGPTYTYEITYGTKTTGWLSSRAAACSAAQALPTVSSDPEYPESASTELSGDNCILTFKTKYATNRETLYINVREACPDGSAPAGGQCPPPKTCDAASELVNGQCVKIVCPYNTGATMNVTVGWARGPTEADLSTAVRTPPKAGSKHSFKYKGIMCETTIDNTVMKTNDSCWASQTPSSTGLYRLSCDYEATYTGNQVGSTPDRDPNRDATTPETPPPPCDGYPGYINGKAACVAKSPEPQQPANPAIDPAETKKGNPAAGSDGSKDLASRTPGDGDGSNKGGPPTSGDGGTLRGAGVGNAGGTGEKGDGTGKVGKVEGKEQQACGAPDQPKCRIDETGTPDGKGKWDEATKSAAQGHEKVLENIKGAKDRTAPAWTFTFALPSGCSPYTVNMIVPIVIDICAFQPMIHGIMTMIWLAVTVWTCIGMVGRTVHTA